MVSDLKYPPRQAYEMPSISLLTTLKILADLADADGEYFERSGLHIELRPTKARMFLPAEPGASGLNKAEIAKFRQMLIAAIEHYDIGVGRRASAPYAVNFDGLVPMPAAAILAALEPGMLPIDQVPQPGGPCLALVFAPKIAALATPVAEVIRRGRDVRLVVEQERIGRPAVAAVILHDSPADYGLVSTSTAVQGDDPQVALLRGWPVGDGMLWLDHDVAPPSPQALTALARYLRATTDATEKTNIACLARGHRSAVLAFIDGAETPASALADALVKTQSFDLRTTTVTGGQDANFALAKAIGDANIPTGYRVRLQALRPDALDGADVQPLLEEIRDLQERIDQITFLGAPQMRLLRFSDAQLPALADGLRRLPKEIVAGGGVLYAASHAAGRDAPAHFIMYDPKLVNFEHSEMVWRARTENRPMRFWLDPVVADAQVARPSETLLFVPDGTMIAPSLAHFGGDIDETLALALGQISIDDEDVATGADRRKIYVFSPSADPSFTLEVELISRDKFAPLHLQLPWINDYLQVRHPLEVEQTKLNALARDLYEGQLTEKFRAELEDKRAAVETVWADCLNALYAQAQQVLESLQDEVSASSHRLRSAYDMLEATGKRMAEVEKMMAAAQKALTHQDALLAKFETKDQQLVEIRNQFEQRVSMEQAQADLAISDTEAEIRALQERLQALQAEGPT